MGHVMHDDRGVQTRNAIDLSAIGRRADPEFGHSRLMALILASVDALVGITLSNVDTVGTKEPSHRQTDNTGCDVFCDGQTLIGTSIGGIIQLWDISAGRERIILRGGRARRSRMLHDLVDSWLPRDDHIVPLVGSRAGSRQGV